jgi:hypothetical protein
MWGFGEWGCWYRGVEFTRLMGTAMFVVGDPANCVADSLGIASARVAF